MARSRPSSNDDLGPLGRTIASDASVRRDVTAQRPALSKSTGLATPHPLLADGRCPPSKKKKRGEAEANALNARMDELRIELFLAFPDLEEMAVGYAGSSCGFAIAGVQCDVRTAVDKAAETVLALDEILESMDAPEGSNQATGCQWLPFAISLFLCTYLGPVLYWPCAYIAMCSFCFGGFVDWACM